MKKISKITNDSFGHIRVKSEYLNNGIVGVNKKLQSEFNSFVLLLSIEDAKYNEDSINILLQKWNRVIKFISNNGDLLKVKKQMKILATLGQLGEMIYDLFNIDTLSINYSNYRGFDMFKHECNNTIIECNDYLKGNDDEFLEFYVNELTYMDLQLDDYLQTEDKEEINTFKNQIKHLLKCIKDKIDSKNLAKDIELPDINNKDLQESLSQLLIVFKEQLRVPANELEFRPIDYCINTVFYSIYNEEDFDIFNAVLNKIKEKDEIGYSIYKRYKELYQINSYSDLTKLILENKENNITQNNFSTDKRKLFNIYVKNFKRIVLEINSDDLNEELLNDYLDEIEYIKEKIVYCKKAITAHVYDNIYNQLDKYIGIINSKIDNKVKVNI